MAEAIAGDGLLTAFTPVLHIFLQRATRLCIALAQPFHVRCYGCVGGERDNVRWGFFMKDLSKSQPPPFLQRFHSSQRWVICNKELQMSPLKVSRCSHTNGSSEMEGAFSPSGSEEVLMCDMCQAVLCEKVIRWVTCSHGKYISCPCIIVMWRNKCTSLCLQPPFFFFLL